MHTNSQTPSLPMNFIEQNDPGVWAAIDAEAERQQDGLEMIASENYVSPAIMQAVGSVLTNKYAEGYPGRRYYGGCKHVDVVETLARDRAKQLFGQPGEFRRVSHGGATRRHGVGARSSARRPLDAWHEIEHLRNAVSLRGLRCDA